MFYYTGIPIITYVTAVVCVLNYIRMTQLMKQNSPNDSAVQCGAVFGPYIMENGQYWRLITGGFVHFSIFHLLMNVYVLISLGGAMEAAFGHILFFILLYGPSSWEMHSLFTCILTIPLPVVCPAACMD